MGRNDKDESEEKTWVTKRLSKELPMITNRHTKTQCGY